MFKMFAGGGNGESWPLSKIVSAIKGQYDGADVLAEDGPVKIYGVSVNGVNFIVALMQSEPGSGRVIELGFFARFVGFPVDLAMIDGLNSNLQISVATLEGADLFLMAGMGVQGAFNQRQFSGFLDDWRADLALTVHKVTDGQVTMSAAGPQTELEAAQAFAVNKAAAPEGDGAPSFDGLSQFFGASLRTQELCPRCHGKGTSGFFGQTCDHCGGSGYVRRAKR